MTLDGTGRFSGDAEKKLEEVINLLFIYIVNNHRRIVSRNLSVDTSTIFELPAPEKNSGGCHKKSH